MNLTAHERRQLRMALSAAIEWEESLADAHCVAYNPKGPNLPRIAPPEYRNIVNRCARRAANYRRLYEKFK